MIKTNIIILILTFIGCKGKSGDNQIAKKTGINIEENNNEVKMQLNLSLILLHWL